jgi:regulator of protease activity HflC (stomatin/prohibitin superfamily)
MSVNYHLDPAKVVTLHKQGIGKTYESVVLKREIVDVVNEIARPRTALEIYSGVGFVKFKNDVEDSLESNPVLRDRGLVVENTIIYKVYLDPEYEKEIAAKQIANQQALRKQEETKAAQEEAKRIFAMSQAEVEKTRQAAEANKITQITAAEAEKAKRVLEAEGEREANLARASGILAVGKAEAEVAQLKTNALYAGEGGSRRASIEIAEKQAEKLAGMLKGVTVIPDKAIANVGNNKLALEVDR